MSSLESSFSLFETSRNKNAPPNAVDAQSTTSKEQHYQRDFHYCYTIMSQYQSSNDILSALLNAIQDRALIRPNANDNGANKSTAGECSVLNGIIYCILTSLTPKCDEAFDILSKICATKQNNIQLFDYIVDEMFDLIVNNIVWMSEKSVNQLFWFLRKMIESNLFCNKIETNKNVCYLLFSMMRQIDINRITKFGCKTFTPKFLNFISNNLYVIFLFVRYPCAKAPYFYRLVFFYVFFCFAFLLLCCFTIHPILLVCFIFFLFFF